MTKITFEGGRYPVRAGESTLDALVRGGADIHFSCRRGTCHSCILRLVEGNAGGDAQHGLSEDKRARGYFLPCKSVPESDLVLERPRPEDVFAPARLERREPLSEHVVRLRLEPPDQLAFRAGQFVNLRARGVVRSYSIASTSDDYFIELHVQRTPGGVLSSYLCDELAVGDTIDLQGPNGSSCYDPRAPERSLLLVGTGSGLAPLLGVLRDALRHGHTGKISLYHGARTLDGLYLQAELRELEQRTPSFEYVPCLSRELVPGYQPGRVTDIAFARDADLSMAQVFLAGSPNMVQEGRYRAILGGAARELIHADPFVSSAPYMPNDGAKMASLPADPELWEALERGPGLTRILTDFYDRAFQDPKLAPFFHNVTKERAIEKQYEFLREMFARDTTFFGLRPFNAHHWMVISDELFDYRERLIEAAMQRYGLAPHLIRRWLALHEAFRRGIVKSEARGLVIDGVERRLDGFSVETLSIGSLCDGCGRDMPSGSQGSMHRRTGKLYCGHCSQAA